MTGAEIEPRADTAAAFKLSHGAALAIGGSIQIGAQGNLLWRRTYDGPAGGVDIASSVAVDASGNILVTGMSSDGIQGEPADIATVKYDPNGNLLWAARQRGSADGLDSGNAVAVDATGNVYVAGTSYTFRGSSCAAITTGDFVTIKYGPGGGAPLWVRTYDGPGARLAYPSRSYVGCSPCPAPAPFPELVPGHPDPRLHRDGLRGGRRLHRDAGRPGLRRPPGHRHGQVHA